MNNADDPLFRLLESYFLGYLRCARGASEHTIRAYRDSLRLFFIFVAQRCRRSVASLRLSDIDAEVVLEFLAHLESARSNSIATRNCRLVAIRGFAEHLLRNDVEHADQYARIADIPSKKSQQGCVEYLEPDEAKAIIEQPDPGTSLGLRDHALLLCLYNTGARISEALAIRAGDLQLRGPNHVRLHGKGKKDRLCPLWPETSAALRAHVRRLAVTGEPIFRNARGATLTRDGVAWIINKHAQSAAANVKSLRGRHVTPHVFRHGCAVALLQSGVDVTVIRDYLGHASIATTSRYLSTNLEMKRAVLTAFWKRSGLDRRTSARRWRPTPNLLAFLESL